MRILGPTDKPIECIDPSEHYRPEGKHKDKFRQFNEIDEDPIQQRVRETYLEMHTNQTVDFVKGKKAKWTKFDHIEMPVMEALEELNSLVDASDPDVDVPNIVHAFQTAERIRANYPEMEWFQLVGLIHDLGKVMCLFGEPQWSVVGDTFAVGCELGQSIVFKDTTFHKNPDINDPIYSKKYGMYSEGIGLENVLLSWGHDEYLYQVLKNHPNCTLPEEGLYMIRFHSFYPWHSGGDYDHLCNDKDRKMLHWVKKFNEFDLYTKSDSEPDIDSLIPYYQGLIDKFIPGLVRF